MAALAGTGAGQIGDASAAPAGRAACEDLPYRGLFYGNLVHGDTVSEVRVACGEPVHQPFTAERSGPVPAVQWYLRFDRECHGWAGCYSGGDGGAIRIAIHAADAGGIPRSDPLGQSAVNGGSASIFDIGGPGGGFPVWRLDHPAQLSAGQRYALVLRNESCSGYVSTDGMLADWGPARQHDGRAGPYYGGDRPTYRGARLEQNHLSLFALHYADGTVVGPGAIWATASNREQIGGALLARQRFTLIDAAREVDAVHVWAWRSAASAGDLTVTVRDTEGGVLGTGIIPAAALAISSNHEEGAPARPWARTRLDAPVRLEKGRSHTVELRAAGCCHQTIPAHRSARWPAREGWAEGRAEFSEDGGGTWRCAASSDGPACGVDLSLGFSVTATTLDDGTRLQCRPEAAH
ncbi:hypothetical protein SH611_08135 [Geminicoccaceae bacterium 1502E]|nr:hypothetical protein [Geminicoccaceae bacterium 1502E]